MSDAFRGWLSGLRDARAKARIASRIRSATLGNFGDVEPVGDGVYEMRIHHGPGYRLYYVRRGEALYLLLIGGDKASQSRDIQKEGDGHRPRSDLLMHCTPFDASEFLDSEEAIAEYLAAALADPDPDLFVAALGDVAKARGMTQIAREAGLGRESLYKALTPGSKLRYETIRKVMDVLGVKLTVEPQA